MILVFSTRSGLVVGKTLPLIKPSANVLPLADAYSVLSFDISHLELQKLAYFMQEMGQRDLKLNYTSSFRRKKILNISLFKF